MATRSRHAVNLAESCLVSRDKNFLIDDQARRDETAKISIISTSKKYIFCRKKLKNTSFK